MMQDTQKNNQLTQPTRPTLDIVAFPDARLRQVSVPVVSITPDDRTLIEAMLNTMELMEGVGLAAPQVGVSRRIVVVDVPALNAYEGSIGSVTHGRFVLVNPSIVAQKGEMTWHEGCLSVSNVEEDVKRHAVVDVLATNEEGRQVEFRASGLLAACIQHEIDHLDGVLFIDRLSRLRRDIVLRRLKKEQRASLRLGGGG